MRRLALILVSLCACGGEGAIGKKVHADPIAPPAESKAFEGGVGVDDAELKELLVEHWDWTLESSPTWATTLGDHRFDSELGDNSHAAIEERRARRRTFLDRARAIDAARIGPEDLITRDLFVEQLSAQVASETCRMEEWSVSARGNPIVSFNNLPENHVLTSPRSGRELLARYRKIPRSVDNSIDALRRGLAAGLVANRASLELALDMVSKQLAENIGDWALVNVEGRIPKDWKPEQRSEFLQELRTIVARDIRPAYERYAALLRDELVPAGRGADAVGLSGLSLGSACYAARLQHYTGLPVTAKELHDIGLRELDKINDEMRALGQVLFATSDLAKIIETLTTDRELYFSDSKAILAKAEAAVARAREAMPKMFRTLPKAPVVVVPIPDYEAPYTTIAYYRGPHADGSKPGEYFVNTFKPEVRPKFEMEVLAYHESIPGHHLQIAISQELEALPAFRRYTGNTAFVEGWALYTERLADEFGLYTGPLDRMGMLSYDAWRASRLVVDTGLHDLGWTRERAEQFMREHTALTMDNIRNEVDRYITWPGQAVAYKVGQRTLFELRAQAKSALGKRFELRGFHDAVLTHGAVSLQVLRRNVEAWVLSRR